jgi:hypothetical protein
MQVRTEGRGEFRGGSPLEKRPKIWNFLGHEIVLDDRQKLLDVSRLSRIETPISEGGCVRRSAGHLGQVLPPLPYRAAAESLPPLPLGEV